MELKIGKASMLWIVTVSRSAQEWENRHQVSHPFLTPKLQSAHDAMKDRAQGEGAGAKGKWLKCLLVKAMPKPEFCIPTSMDMDRLSASSHRKKREEK